MTSDTPMHGCHVDTSSARGQIPDDLVRLIASPRKLAALFGIALAGAILPLGCAGAAEQADIAIPMDQSEIRTAGMARGRRRRHGCRGPRPCVGVIRVLQ